MCPVLHLALTFFEWVFSRTFANAGSVCVCIRKTVARLPSRPADWQRGRARRPKGRRAKCNEARYNGISLARFHACGGLRKQHFSLPPQCDPRGAFGSYLYDTNGCPSESAVCREQETQRVCVAHTCRSGATSTFLFNRHFHILRVLTPSHTGKGIASSSLPLDVR